MIWPLPRAHDLTAPERAAGLSWHEGGADGLHPSCRGARHAGAGSYNARVGRAPADPSSAFVPVSRHDLDQILCHEEERGVARDNTVVLDGVVLQIDKQRGLRRGTGLRVLVHRHLDGRHSVWWGPRCLGWFTATGRPLRERAA